MAAKRASLSAEAVCLPRELLRYARKALGQAEGLGINNASCTR